MAASKKRARAVSSSAAPASRPAALASSARLLGLSWPVFVAIAIVVWLAALLRIWASLDEFWMDEIWSLFQFAGIARSPWDIFTFHHDNNHYLVTLWMYLLGVNQSDWTLYRIPAIVAGVGTVILSAIVARRWGSAATVAATVLTGSSYMLICMASEARGYALAGFFALAAILALDRFLTTRSLRAAALFALATILGTLSHLTFVDVYFALFVWSCVVLGRRPATLMEAMRHLARLHTAPLVVFGLLYVIDVRRMRIGGGDARTLEDVIMSSLALVVGGSNATPALGWILGAVVVAGAIAAIVLLARSGSDLWILFAAGIFVAPALLLLFHRPEVIYERYFYLNILLLLLLLSYLVGRVWQIRMFGPLLASAALVTIVIANGWQTSQLLRVGRGHFRDALAYIIEANPDQHEIHLAGDGKRSRMVLYMEFYGRYARDCRFVIDEIKPGMPEVPEWLLIPGAKDTPSPRLSPFRERGEYELQRIYSCAGLSGMNVAVYRWRPADARRETIRPAS